MTRTFDHIDLRVRDFAACEAFCRTLLPRLGFTLRVEIEGWLQFEGGGSGASEFFGVTEDQDHRPNQSRIAFWADSESKVDELARMLSRIGAMAIEVPDFESSAYYAVYFNDPSGNAFEICCRSQKSTSLTA